VRPQGTWPVETWLALTGATLNGEHGTRRCLFLARMQSATMSALMFAIRGKADVTRTWLKDRLWPEADIQKH
jgi:hypothetical protein